LADQALHGGRCLGANAFPIGQTVLRNADPLFIGGGNGVVKTDALNEAAITTGALVSDHNTEKRAGFSTTTSESNNDHSSSFG
jgi:hypothetical protein